LKKKNQETKEMYLTKGYIHSIMIGLIIGSFFSIAGFILTLLGLSGSIEWIIESNGIQSKLSNASPGVFFALLGLLTLFWYKPSIKTHKSQVIDSLSQEKSTQELISKIKDEIVSNILSNRQINDLIMENSKKLSSDLTFKRATESVLNDLIDDNIIHKRFEVKESQKLASNQNLTK
jgi:hypothetical protein